jgi:anti-anti-sigma factor
VKSHCSRFEFDYGMESSADVLRVYLRGQLVYETLEATQSCWGAVRAGARPRVELDLSGVSFMASAALGSLISLRHSLESRGCSLRIRAMSDAVREILDVTGLIRLFMLDDADVESVRESAA